MISRLVVSRENGEPHRAVTQLAAVLGVLRALRVIELREEWRKSQQRLLHEEALQYFFWKTCPLVTVGQGAVAPTLLDAFEGEPCEELSIALGLMVWLAWECELDLDIARERNGSAGVEEDQWPRLQCLACLARSCANDSHAIDMTRASVGDTPRRSKDGEAWLLRHLAFLKDVGAIVDDPMGYKRLDRPPQPGDLVYLASKFAPRVRIVVDVHEGKRGYVVTVVDEEVDSGTRKFLANRVECLGVPGRAARGVG